METKSIAELWPMVERTIEEDFRRRVDHAVTEGLFAANAHWQQAEIFRWCMPLAIFHAQRLPDYHAFRARWLELFGEVVWPWLPSLFAAAAVSPEIVGDARKALLLSLVGQADLSH